jgi:xylulokinase
MDAFLGIDIGTSGTKTLAIDEQGRILASVTSAEYPLYHPEPLWSEQRPADWWQATCATIKAVVQQAKLKPQQVRAIGLSGQMHGSVFLNAQHEVIRPAILWNDQRTTPQCRKIEDLAGGRAQLIRMVANPALEGFTAPKILWLRENEPENFAQLRKVLLPKDYIRFLLTGQFATEVSDASGMLLLDVAGRDWSDELLNKLELSRELLAKVYESHAVTGQLRPPVAAELGLSPQCVVVGGAGDCAAGAVGNGIVKSGSLSTSIGTSGVMFVHSDEVKIDPLGRIHTFCHAVDGKWHLMGVNLSAGGSLQWFKNQLCKSLVAFCQTEGLEPYDILMREAAAAPRGSQGLLFLPYLSGERTPHADATARGCFIGLTRAHTRGHLVRAIIEGVTYALRESLEIIRELGVPVNEIRASGGGSRSLLWRQIQTDVFGQSVHSLKAEEGPAYGVALLAGVGTGRWTSITQACSETIQIVGRTTIDASAHQFYNKAFQLYRQQYGKLRDTFQAIAALGGGEA